MHIVMNISSGILDFITYVCIREDMHIVKFFITVSLHIGPQMAIGYIV